MGAGTMVFASIIMLSDGGRSRLTVGMSMWAASLSMIVGFLFLLADLSNPDRALFVWRSFVNTGSWMTCGAWGVLAAILVSIVSALLLTSGTSGLFSDGHGDRMVGNGFQRVLGFLGISLGLFVSAYTGMLLKSAHGIPFWDTYLLPALFIVSALGCGVALIEIISASVSRYECLTMRHAAMLGDAGLVLVVIEAAILTGYLLAMSRGEVGMGGVSSLMATMTSVRAIVYGRFASCFWLLVVGCGLIAPAIAGLLALGMRGKDTTAILVSGAVGVLVGGCALRFIILLAATQTDAVGETLMALI